MENNKPLIHLFKTPGGAYFYDVNRNSIVRIKKTLWELLECEQNDSKNKAAANSDFEDYILIKKMKEDGFLSSNRVKEVIHPADEVLPYYINNKVNMVTLQVTQQCNLRCDYCIYSGGYNSRTHSQRRMDLETAKKGIDFLVTHSKDNNTIAIGFYGGEPLLEFELIKRCIEYAKKTTYGKDVLFSITTNGTLLNDNIVQFLAENEISLLISLDGPKVIQDKARKFAFNNCGTFDKIIQNIETIRIKHPDYFKKIRFNAVLNPENDFYCINSFFNDFEVVKDASTMFSFISTNYSKNEAKVVTEDYLNKYNYEYFKHLISKLGRMNEKYVSKVVKRDFDDLERKYHRLKLVEKLPEKAHHSGPCIPGVQRLFVDTEGILYPCEKVSENSEVMRIGDIDKGFNIEKIRTLMNVGKLSEEKCKNCWAFRLCNLCAASADILTNLSADNKLSHCNSVKRSVENKLKDICMLKEMKFNFNEGFELSVKKVEEM